MVTSKFWIDIFMHGFIIKMLRLKIIILVIYFLTCTSSVKDFHSLDHLQPKASCEAQRRAAHDLIKRIVPKRASDFNVFIDTKIGAAYRDTFNIKSSFKTVNITGTSGVAIAMGFYYYLNNYCGCQVTWAGSQLNLPERFKVITSPGITITTNDRFRYYLNVCTVSYSFAFYNWTDWEKQIDWMALHGINLPLAFTGQEAIFQRVYMRMGLTFKELQSHFSGPAFLAWSRMGNIRGWGGPLSQTWINDQLVLQHKILDRMRSLGMIPVLPGFAGHVPQNLTRVYPNANVSRLGDWGHFSDKYCCTYLLDFQDPLFVKIGSAFIQEMKLEFGTDHIYNADTFNEMTPLSNSTEYLTMAGRKVYEAMNNSDPKAVWLMQGWLFQKTNFWKQPQIKSLLQSVPIGKMIILDLSSELDPIYQTTESYYGQPFIWCMLHNFGGTMELYGMLDTINNGPFIGRTFSNSSMIGIGLTPEGINQNEVMYEFMMENSWRKHPRNVTEWISNFAVKRYGSFNKYVDKAWQLLKRSVFNDTHIMKDKNRYVIPTWRPRLHPLLEQEIWYNPEDLFMAWENFILASESYANNSLFLYDLVDVTRNSLQDIAIRYYNDTIEAYRKNKLVKFVLSSNKLLGLISDMETLLASDKHFLLGTWIKSAQTLAKNIDGIVLYTYNARNQITLWGPTGQHRDYASKQWSGLIKSYYLPRWKLFIDMLNASLYSGAAFNQDEYYEVVFDKVENPFQKSNDEFPTETVGNPVNIAKQLYTKYRPETRSLYISRPEDKKRGKYRLEKNSPG